MGAKLRSIVTSFIDGMVGEGLFGHLSIPDMPTQIFKLEPGALPAYKLRLTGMPSREDAEKLKQAIHEALDAARTGRQVEIEEPGVPEGAHHVAG